MQWWFWIYGCACFWVKDRSYFIVIRKRRPNKYHTKNAIFVTWRERVWRWRAKETNKYVRRRKEKRWAIMKTRILQKYSNLFPRILLCHIQFCFDLVYCRIHFNFEILHVKVLIGLLNMFTFIRLHDWHWACTVRIQKLRTPCVDLLFFQAMVLYGLIVCFFPLNHFQIL